MDQIQLHLLSRNEPSLTLPTPRHQMLLFLITCTVSIASTFFVPTPHASFSRKGAIVRWNFSLPFWFLPRLLIRPHSLTCPLFASLYVSIWKFLRQGPVTNNTAITKPRCWQSQQLLPLIFFSFLPTPYWELTIFSPHQRWLSQFLSKTSYTAPIEQF